MKSTAQAQVASAKTKFLVIEDPDPNPEQMEFPGSESIRDAEVSLAIQYLDPDLEGFAGILFEIPSGEELLLTIQYLDPEFSNR